MIIKCFLAVKSDQVLASPPIKQLQESVCAASGYGVVKQNQGYTALIWGTVPRCYIKIYIWSAVPGSYSSHVEVKNTDSPCSPVAAQAGNMYTVLASLCPTGQEPEIGMTCNQQPTQRGMGESSAAEGIYRKLSPCKRGFASVTWADIYLNQPYQANQDKKVQTAFQNSWYNS